MTISQLFTYSFDNGYLGCFYFFYFNIIAMNILISFHQEQNFDIAYINN